jgi:hypothetical protein
LCFGLALSMSDAHILWTVWLGMPGTLYLRALKFLVGPLVFCSVVVGFSALSQLGVSSSTIGPKCAMLYLVTSIAGSIEGLVATYTLKPAWGEIASTPVTVEPAHAAFDARPMITLTNEAFVPAYYNASTAASVSLRFARADASQRVSVLHFWYERAVTFELPAALGPDGPLPGHVDDLQVWTADDALAFGARDGSLRIDSGKAPHPFSSALENLLYSLVPDNIVSTFYGGSGALDSIA